VGPVGQAVRGDERTSPSRSTRTTPENRVSVAIRSTASASDSMPRDGTRAPGSPLGGRRAAMTATVGPGLLNAEVKPPPPGTASGIRPTRRRSRSAPSARTWRRTRAGCPA
jgi:hypothetical protein